MTNHTTFTNIFQTTEVVRKEILCGICDGWVLEPEATAGPYDADGNLTLICNKHLRNSHQLINLLADYIVDEQLECLRRKQNNMQIKETVPDAWFLY